MCDIETAQISGGLEVNVGGVLRRQLAQEGDELPVGALVAVVADAEVAEAEVDAVVAAFQASFVPAAAAGAGEGAQPQKVEIGGRRIRYLKRGEGGEPVLLLHGFGGDLGNWLFNHDALAEKHLVYERLKYKRLAGVDAALRKLADNLFPGGTQAPLFRDALASTKIPVLVIWGARDRIIPASHAEGLPGHVKVEVLPDAGHMVQMEAAGAVNRLLGSFLH